MDLNNLPKHLAFIVDGNRRWAKKNNLPVVAGHKHVVDKTINDIVFYCLKKKISHVTFWTFSTDNWKRGEEFADKMWKLLAYALKLNTQKYEKAGIRLNTIGDLSKLPSKLVLGIEALKNRSKDNTKLTVTIALNYGGRDDILQAVKSLVKSGDFNKDNVDKLTEEDFSQYLYTADLPDPDLIIRTGGDIRLSGFMSWQNKFSELAFTNTLMPDFNLEELEKILEDFSQRQRRLGK